MEEELPEDIIDSIREEALGEIYDHTDISVVLPASATSEEIMEATGKAVNEAEQSNQEMYDRLCEIVKDCWLQMKGFGQNGLEDSEGESHVEGPILQM